MLTTSGKITSHFRRIFPIDEEQITTLHTGIDVNLYHSLGNNAAMPVQPGTPVVGMVSVLRSWKGHDTFFDSIRILLDQPPLSPFSSPGSTSP